MSSAQIAVPTAILARLAKVLALRDGTDNPDEAMAAMLAAQKLMLEYHLSEEDAAASVALPTVGDVVRHALWRGGNRISWFGCLGHLLAENMRCATYWDTEKTLCHEGHDGKPYLKTEGVLRVMGLPDDTEMCRAVFLAAKEAIERFATRHAQRHTRENPRSRTPTRQIRQDYIFGFLAGLRMKFEDQRESLSQSQALIVVMPGVVREVIASLTLVPVHSSVTVYASEGYCQGHADGARWGQDQILTK